MEKRQGGIRDLSRGPAYWGAAMGKMEDSIIGESCEQPWLPARREGTERRGSQRLEVLGVGWHPATQEGLG